MRQCHLLSYKKIIVKGVSCFSSLNNVNSQLKQRKSLSASKAVKRMLSLLGLTIIGSVFFSPRHLVNRSLISLLAVAVRPRRGVPLSRQDLSSITLPKASLNAAFPLLLSPL